MERGRGGSLSQEEVDDVLDQRDVVKEGGEHDDGEIGDSDGANDSFFGNEEDEDEDEDDEDEDEDEEEDEGDSKTRAFLSSLQKLLDEINAPIEEEVAEEEAESASRPRAVLNVARGRGLGKRAKELKKQLGQAKRRIKTMQRKMNSKVTAMRRKVITGSSDKRVRDFLKEVPVVKTIDKVSFTLGVLMLLVVEYMALEHPDYFGYFYGTFLVPLLLARWNLYVKEKFQYFLFDFCYFLNLSCMICVFFPNALNGVLIRSCFVMANGPVGWAIVAWRNSLVFHSLEKLTTVYIHALPTMLTFVWRWLPDNEAHRRALCGTETDTDSCSLSFFDWWVYPLTFYLLWQAFYLLITEVLHREKLDSDADLQTSLRWMARSQNGMVAAARQLFIRLGIMHHEEQFDHTAWKTKGIFVTSQLVYTLVGMLPTALFFSSYPAHSIFLILAWTICAWNGAGYYINVFSHRYMEKLEKLEQLKMQAEQAVKDAQPKPKLKPRPAAKHTAKHGKRAKKKVN